MSARRFACRFACGRIMLQALAVAVVLASVAPLAHAEKRVALVIGIDHYSQLDDRFQLKKAVSDAEAVGAALTRLGFAVDVARNPTLAEMIEKVGAFVARVKQGDTAFVFFSGHGMSPDGVNLLLPSDFPPLSMSPGIKQLVRKRAIAEAELIGAIRDKLTDKATGTTKGLVLAVLDACRNNPFNDPGTDFGRALGAPSGGVAPRPTAGVFSIYSAGAGQIALDRLGDDDPSPNSVFTRVFIKELVKPGRHLGDVIVDVRQQVAALAAKVIDPETRRPYVQTPAYYDETLGGRIFLAGRATATRLRDDAPATTSPEVVRLQEKLKALEEQLKKKDEPKVAVGVVPEKAETAPPAPHLYKPGDTFKDCADCPEMVVVPAGSFLMGSPATEAGRDDDEGPQHRVTIAKPFAVGRFEVTFDQWDACVDQLDQLSRRFGSALSPEQANVLGFNRAGYGCNAVDDDGNRGRGQRPVINVSLDDAKAYVAWLSRKTGKSYRLLSEAEWEYVARAGAATRFWFGDRSDELCDYENHLDANNRLASRNLACTDGYVRSAEVGHYKPNPFGLYDTLGNVREWTADCWNWSYDEDQQAPSDGSAWTEGYCDLRVVRGGSWNDPPEKLRSANRDGVSDNTRTSFLGFRVARAVN